MTTRMLSVTANIDHTDAASGLPRVAGEVFDMPEARARLKAAQGFVTVNQEQAPDAEGDVVDMEDVRAMDTQPMDVVKPKAKRGGGRKKADG